MHRDENKIKTKLEIFLYDATASSRLVLSSGSVSRRTASIPVDHPYEHGVQHAPNTSVSPSNSFYTFAG